MSTHATCAGASRKHHGGCRGGSAQRPRYAVVTPALNEAATLSAMARSLMVQSIPFEKWIVVDDGSSDGTAEIVRQLAERDSRIQLIQRPRRDERNVGVAGIEAAMVGLSSLPGLFGYDFVANLDADITFASDYFERIFAHFKENDRLGIAGGECYSQTPRGLALDKGPREHVHGATKIYRRECLHDIWPLAEVWGWDAVDEGRAQVAGWETRTYSDVRILHHKPMSGGTGKVLHGKFVFGRTCHFLGYRADFALLRSALNCTRPPYLIGGLAMGWGFLSGWMKRAEQIDEPDFVEHLRASQAERLRALIAHGRESGAR